MLRGGAHRTGDEHGIRIETRVGGTATRHGRVGAGRRRRHRLQRLHGRAPRAAARRGGGRAPRDRAPRRAAFVLRRRTRRAGAAPAQHQRRGFGVRGAAGVRATEGHAPRVRRRPARLRLFRPVRPPLRGRAVRRRGPRHARRDRRRARRHAGRRARRVARVGVRRARRDRSAAALPHPRAGHAHRLQPPVRGPEWRRTGDPRDPRHVRLLHLPAVEPRGLRPADEPAQHPLLPRAHLRVERHRRGHARLRLRDHAPARRAARALRLRIGPAVLQGHPRRLRAPRPCRCGCRTARAATSRISARPAGRRPRATGASSPSTRARWCTSSTPRGSWPTTTRSWQRGRASDPCRKSLFGVGGLLLSRPHATVRALRFRLRGPRHREEFQR